MSKRVLLNKGNVCVALCAVTLAIGLAACDGGGDSPTAPPPPAEAATADNSVRSAPPEGRAPAPREPGDEPPATALSEPGQPPEAEPVPFSVALPGVEMAAAGGQNKVDLCHWDREAMAFVQIRVGQPGFDNHLAQHPMDKPLPTWWLDADADGFGDAAFPLEACDQPAGYVDNDDDCDDAASSCTTVCGGDADGDGRADCLDRCSDTDTDGYGDDESGTIVGGGPIPVGGCTTDGSTPCDVGPACLGGDCNDAATSCTTDCSDGDGDGTAECLDQCIDADGDGYGSDNAGSVVGAGSVAVEDCTTDGASACVLTAPCLGEDCDDGDAGINPGADDSDCDGDDDDCDGTADDDYVETPTSCGVGVCEASGQLECQGGSEVDTCAPGAPGESPEMTCDDNLDNDCDGLTDAADADDCGDQPPVAGNDWIVGCSLGADLKCTFNAPAGTLFAANPGSTASGYSGADFDPEGQPLSAFIAGQNVVGATGDPWSPPGPQPRTCTADRLCTTDSNFVVGGSSLTVNANGSFTLTYETTVAPFGSLIGEFLYRVQDPGGQQSDPALVEVIISP